MNDLLIFLGYFVQPRPRRPIRFEVRSFTSFETKIGWAKLKCAQMTHTRQLCQPKVGYYICIRDARVYTCTDDNELCTRLKTRYCNKKHLKNVGPIRHCESRRTPIHQVSLLSHARIDIHDDDDDNDNNDNDNA